MISFYFEMIAIISDVKIRIDTQSLEMKLNIVDVEQNKIDSRKFEAQSAEAVEYTGCISAEG